jgi:two-component system chemotaxis response regulator CheY
MHLSPSAKIVIADDLIPMLTGLRRALGQLGFSNVFDAMNGEEAFAALEANPDAALVISDWNMEPMDGLALLAAIRADARFAKLPFILISADANQTMRERAARMGVSLVLPKPFDAEILRNAIAGLAAPD